MLLTSLRERFRIVDVGLLSPFSGEIFVVPVAQRSKSSLNPTAPSNQHNTEPRDDKRRRTRFVVPHENRA